MSACIDGYIDEGSDLSDEDFDQDACKHSQTTNIDGSTVCTSCGIKIDEALLDNETRYYGAFDTRYSKNPSRHTLRKDEERNLYTDLEPLGFPQEIIERANVYYREIIKDKIYRAGNRISIVFACVYHTYLDLAEPCVPAELANRFKLDKKGISNGLKTFSKVFRKRPEKKYIDAMDLIPKLLKELRLEPEKQKTCIKDINTIYNFIQSKSKNFASSNPQSTAAGLVYYYLKLNNVDINKSDFSKVVKLTDITFTKIAHDAHKILSNDDSRIKL